jgi:hypothetical protein
VKILWRQGTTLGIEEGKVKKRGMYPAEKILGTCVDI